jgi:hypothetical protein
VEAEAGCFIWAACCWACIAVNRETLCAVISPCVSRKLESSRQRWQLADLIERSPCYSEQHSVRHI